MKRYTIGIFLCFIALLSFSSTNAQQFKWIRGGGTTETLPSGPLPWEEVKYMCIDQNGNIYALSVVGTDPLTADTFSYPGTFYSQTDILVTSYNCSGQMRWAKLIEGPDGVSPFGMTVDTTGHVYIAGQFGNVHPTIGKTLKIGYDTTFSTTPSYIGSGLLQLDTNGNYKWIKLLGGNTTLSLKIGYLQNPVLMDKSNNAHFICRMPTGVLIMTGVTSTRGFYDLTYDVSGTLKSAVRLDLDSQWYVQGAVIDQSTGKLYAYGEIDASYYGFGTTTDTFFAACFAADRSRKWQYFAGHGDDDALTGIKMDGSKQLYFAGAVQFVTPGRTAFVFNDDSVVSTANKLAIIMTTDTNGHVGWIKHYDDALAGNAFLGLALLPNANVAAVGYYGGKVISGSDSTITSNGDDAYFVIVDSSGKTKLMQAIQGNGFYDAGNAIVSDKIGNLYIGGRVVDTLPTSAGIPSYHSVGGESDFFVLKYGYDCSCTSAPSSAYTVSGTHKISASYTGTTAVLDSVVWSFGDGSPTVKGSTATHTYSTLGTYHLCATAYTECGTDTHCQDVVYSVNEVSNVHGNNNIRVYPNPAKDELNVSGVEENTTYRLLSVSGALTQQGIIRPGSNVISTNRLTPGVYILEMRGSDGERNVTRVVKE